MAGIVSGTSLDHFNSFVPVLGGKVTLLCIRKISPFVVSGDTLGRAPRLCFIIECQCCKLSLPALVVANKVEEAQTEAMRLGHFQEACGCCTLGDFSVFCFSSSSSLKPVQLRLRPRLPGLSV